MLATLVIGLREGLEAALIVGIIAAFLRNDGRSIRPMWLGVGLAVVLSIAVGVGLDLVEQSLPQAAQEAMESVIGVVAVVFVTTMIVWMSVHARGMRKQLEAEAAAALTRGGALALAVMAFLAVLKEGFETSVFLLATFSAAQSATLAALGAVIGVLLAVVIGWGIYAGGVRLNLARFFRVTGAFLILVAAGLTITTLRTAHEAGWLNAGQQPTVNLSWLVAPGSIQAALITGVLGVPADPRLIEVIGWFAYAVPVTAFVFWPQARRLRGRALVRFEFTAAAVLAVTGVLLAVTLPRPSLDVPASAPLAAAADGSAATIGAARLTNAGLQLSFDDAADTVVPLPAEQERRENHAGVDATAWTVTDAGGSGPAVLSLDELVILAGGRLPVGLNPQQHPGPFAAQWSISHSTTVWAAGGVLLDAQRQSTAVVTVSGSGLVSPRSLSVAGPGADAGGGAWQLAAAYRDAAAAAIARTAAADAEHQFWAVDVPLALAVAALVLVTAASRNTRRARSSSDPALAAVPPRPQAAAQADVH